jgi:hypothetical protein
LLTDGLSLHLNGNLQPLLVCTMLYSMRVQLDGLRSLTLSVTHSEDWIDAEDVHGELGEMTQLTQLCLDLNNMSVSTLKAKWQVHAALVQAPWQRAVCMPCIEYYDILLYYYIT